MTHHKFRVGDIIHHKRYGYRGVIAALDQRFAATEDWYQKNQTQPGKDQPWYHVLVDGAADTTYVAEENLEPDETRERVSHPLINRFFTAYHKGRYHTESLN